MCSPQPQAISHPSAGVIGPRTPNPAANALKAVVEHFPHYSPPQSSALAYGGILDQRFGVLLPGDYRTGFWASHVVTFAEPVTIWDTH